MKNLPEGWLTAPEAKQLAKLAAGQIVLELGAWKGRSTVVMAEVANHVFSVDRHQGIWGEDSLPDYLTNVRGFGNVTIIVGAFENVVPHITDIQLVYIDGDHDHDSVIRDIGLACPLEPSVVAFHDWDFFDVKQAGEEAFGRAADGVVGSVAWFRL